MTVNQSLVQQTVRNITGTAGSYNSDWSAMFDQFGIAAGDFNGRQLAWINTMLGTSYADLPGARAAYAAVFGVTNWDSLPGVYTDILTDDLIDVTRAGATATFFDANGALQVAPANTPRLDHNPATNAFRGLLIEPAATNRSPNGVFSGGVDGSPGTVPTGLYTFTTLTGLTRTLSYVTVDGLPVMRIRLAGTPSAAGNYFIGFFSGTTVAALTGQVWKIGANVNLSAGSQSGLSALRFGLDEYTSALAFIRGNTSVFTIDGTKLTAARKTAQITLSGGATTAYVNGYIRLDLSGAAVDFTLDIAAPTAILAEATESSLILTPLGASSTRNADVALISGAAFSSIWNATEGTVYSEFEVRSITAAANRVIFDAANAGITNAVRCYIETTGVLRYQVLNTSVSVVFATPGSVVLGVNKLAISYKQDDYAVSLNGALVTDSAGAMPTGIDRMGIGSAVNATSPFNGLVKSLGIVPKAIPDAALNGLTA